MKDSGRMALATPAEVAKHLGVPLRTLSQWRYLGVGPAYVKVGRHVRYRWSAVERYEDEHEQGAA